MKRVNRTSALAFVDYYSTWVSKNWTGSSPSRFINRYRTDDDARFKLTRWREQQWIGYDAFCDFIEQFDLLWVEYEIWCEHEGYEPLYEPSRPVPTATA